VEVRDVSGAELFEAYKDQAYSTTGDETQEGTDTTAFTFSL